MKTKLLLFVFIVALFLPSVSAQGVFFINQTQSNQQTHINNLDTVGQNFTTVNPPYNVSNLKLEYIEVLMNSSSGVQTVYMNVSNSTYSSNSSVATIGATNQTYRFNFSDAILAKNSKYNFTIFGSSTIAPAFLSVYYQDSNPYAGHNMFLNGVSLFTNDLTFNISMSPHDTVGNWTLNQGTGNYANDSTPFNNNGTLSTPPPLWSTNFNNGSVNRTSLQFYGVNNVSVPTNSTLNLTSSMTLSFWIKTNQTTQGRIIHKFDVGAPFQGYGLTLSRTNVGIFDLYTDGGGWRNNINTHPINDEKWHYVVVNGDSTGSVYIDNSLDGTFVFSPASSSPTNLTIGSSPDATVFFNGTLDEIKIFNYALNESERTAEYQRFQPVPAYPVANINFSSTYPPITTTVPFSWHDTVYPSDRLQVAEDTSFNIMVHDAFYTTDSANVQLNPGKTYYWRVRQYNSTTGTYGNTSETQTFSILSPPSVPASGSSVQGIVYELINGVQTPVSGTQVYLYNLTASFTITTSSNGYFLFQNLAANSNYSIYATNSPIYNPTSVFPVQTGSGTTVTQNLLITRFFSPFVPNYVYEKFSVRSVFDRPFPGVTVSVFEDGSVTPIATKTTDSMGQATFQLIKDNYYRIEFSGGGLTSTQIVYVYGKEEEYLLYVVLGFPTTPNRAANITANLTTFTHNSTWTNLSLIYNDTSSTTTIVKFYAQNITNASAITYVCYQQFTSSAFSVNCTVPANTGLTFTWGYNSSSTLFGNFSEAKVITFGGHGNGSAPLIPTSPPGQPGVPPTVLHWVSIILIVFTASLFGARKVKFGAVVVPIMAAILYGIGWFQGNVLIISVAVIIGVMYYMRASEIKVDF